MSRLLLAVSLLLTTAACTEEQEIELTCIDYCSQAAECDGDVDEDNCKRECMDNVSDCDEDNREAVIDDLQSCAEETCDDFGGCTVGAAVECAFGI